jgi:hypothetical protein
LQSPEKTVGLKKIVVKFQSFKKLAGLKKIVPISISILFTIETATIIPKFSPTKPLGFFINNITQSARERVYAFA